MHPLIRSRRLQQAFSILSSLCTSFSGLGRPSCGEPIFRTAISSLDLLSWPYTYPSHVPLFVIEADISSLPSVQSTIGSSPQTTKQEATQLKNYYKMDISNKGEDQDAMANRKYIHWQDEGVEKIPPNEAEDIQAVADQINAMQKAQYNSHRHCYTGTHARTQGIVKGMLIVKDDLPKHLKQSMFERGGEHAVVCRYSSEPGDPGLDDRIPQPRGFAMKVFNVPGEKFDPTKTAQDIEFNSTPALDLADAKTTKEIIGLRIKYGGNQPELYKHLEARPDTDLQKFRDSVRNTHLESTRQYSQTAYRFGDYVAKYCLVPSSETQKKLYEETVKPNEHEPDILSQWLKNFHGAHDAEYLLQFQLCENLEDQPVEYAGKVWDPEKYPWQTVATLVIPKQDSFNYELKSFWEDHMRIDPWLGLKSLQPLGSPNRLRRVVYPASSKLRRMMNGKKEIQVHEMDQIPGPSPALGGNFLKVN